jgi:hypothetical protein
MSLRVRQWLSFVVLTGFVMHSSSCTTNRPPASRSARPHHQAAHVIRSNQLTVEIMDPNDPGRYNRGVRFTPIAAVLSVRMAGHEFLFDPVEHDPIVDHAGLAVEFDMVAPGDPDAWLPPGYQDARIGEGFVKIGVGVLRKEKQRYTLFQQPKPVELASTTVRWHAERAEFHQRCTGTNGYAYELQAEVRCHENTITTTWVLQNTGSRPFATRQYVHNFFRFDNHDVGRDYTIVMPYDFRASGLQPQQRHEGREIQFVEYIPQWVNIEVTPLDPQRETNTLILHSALAGMSVTCTTSLAVVRTAIHARRGYVSPEQFVELRLQPGERCQWDRIWRFHESVPIAITARNR